MSGFRLALRVSLGGAVCGIFLGIFAGGLLGGVYGVLTGYVSLGLDGALLGGALCGLGGGLYGVFVALTEGKKGTHHPPAAGKPAADAEQDSGWSRVLVVGELAEAPPKSRHLVR